MVILLFSVVKRNKNLNTEVLSSHFKKQFSEHITETERSDLLFFYLWWERERETSSCCSTYLCIHSLIFVCALTGDRTCNLGVSGAALTNWAAWQELNSFFKMYYLEEYWKHVFSKFSFILEREGETERVRHQFVVSLIYAFIGWFLYVSWPEIEPETLVYWGDTLTNWVTWPGPKTYF